MRVLTLFVRNGTEKYPNALREVDGMFLKQLPGVERKTIVIDNALPPQFVQRDHSGATFLGGDNEWWEFSAWNKAITFIGEEIWSFDLVHLVTSAFNTLYVDYLQRFSESMLEAMARRPVCLGHIDYYNDPIRISSYRSQSWIRTSFLFLPPSELRLLKDLVSLQNFRSVFGAGPSEPFLPSGVVSENYARNVIQWLTGSDIGQGSVWHSKVALSDESWHLFKGKAAAIFNEHLFTIRLRAQGTRVIDTTWLASQLELQPASNINWSKSWREQINERGV